MSKPLPPTDQLRDELALHKSTLRRASRPEPREASRNDPNALTHEALRAARRNPAATAALAFGVIAALGPWRSIRLASKAAGLLAVTSRVLSSSERAR